MKISTLNRGKEKMFKVANMAVDIAYIFLFKKTKDIRDI